MKILKLTALLTLSGLCCHALAVEVPESKQVNIPKELSIFIGDDELWAYEYCDLDDDGDTDVLLITKSKKIKSSTKKNNLVLSILERDRELRKVAENKEIFSYLEIPKHLFSGKDVFRFQKNQFSIYQEKHAGILNNSTYTFRKFKNGLWYLIEVENTRTVNNEHTGMIDVVTDFKKYPKNFKKIRFDQFNPNLFLTFD